MSEINRDQLVQEYIDRVLDNMSTKDLSICKAMREHINTKTRLEKGQQETITAITLLLVISLLLQSMMRRS